MWWTRQPLVSEDSATNPTDIPSPGRRQGETGPRTCGEGQTAQDRIGRAQGRERRVVAFRVRCPIAWLMQAFLVVHPKFSKDAILRYWVLSVQVFFLNTTVIRVKIILAVVMFRYTAVLPFRAASSIRSIAFRSSEFVRRIPSITSTVSQASLIAPR